MHLSIFLCVTICIYIKLSMSSFLMFLILIYYQMDHSRLSPHPYLSVNYHSNSKKISSLFPLQIYLIIQFQYRCITVSEFLTCTPQETNLSSRVQGLCAIPFVLSFIDPAYFQRFLGQSIFFQPLQRFSFFTHFVMQVDSLDTVCIFFMGSSDLLNDFLLLLSSLYLHTVWFTLCTAKLYKF